MGVPISNVTRRVVYAASGTGPYNFTFEILAAGDIAVYRDDTLLTLTTNYTVTINSNGTGFVTLTATPTGATQIAIVGNRTISRTTDFVTGGDFFANTLNDELDQQTIFNQQNAEGLQRALIAPQTDPTTIDMTLPRAVDRANKTLAFDANGDPTLGISAADVANAVTYATNAANSATAAASSASAASSSASSASSSASTATTQASNASTSATNAANSASAASTSATNAASSASTAATQASNASTSATNAASSASAASTSASNASTSATNASNSASAAATSASNAATSETNAANSASAAAASAASAANTFDSFDDRYLGTKSSNPTLDNDGNALVAGALYFSTSENIMKVYDGASWIAATSAGNVSFLRFRYVATSGQTTFSGADSNAATLTYTVNNIVVFLNGVSLDQTEYTATSGTSVVLGAGAALNDELVIVAFKSFVTADMVPASTGGTYAGAVRFAAGSASVPSISVSGDTNTGIFFPAADTIAFTEGGVESMRIDASGRVGIGTDSPATTLHLKAAVCNVRLEDADTSAYANVGVDNSGSMYLQADPANSQASSTMYFSIDGTERMRIDSAGNLGLGVTPSAWNLFKALEIGRVGNSFAARPDASQLNIGANWYYASGDKYANTGASSMYEQASGKHVWYNAPSGTAGNAITFTQAMTLDASGNLLVATTGTTAVQSNTAGAMTYRSAAQLEVNGNATQAAFFGRTNDGMIVGFYESGTREGDISVSGTTVSYNGGHLSRYAQTQTAKDESLLKGTVLSNLDEMNVYTDADGNPVENEQLNKVKVSGVEGDANVAGVFVNWSYDEQHQVDEINMAMTGDMIIRIAQGVTVQKGDLLMSAGDGTAKPQGDDIVRSKTVAKVTSNHVTCTYDDGSYCVPCVLMAC
jgi:hypothetical protein